MKGKGKREDKGEERRKPYREKIGEAYEERDRRGEILEEKLELLSKYLRPNSEFRL